MNIYKHKEVFNVNYKFILFIALFVAVIIGSSGFEKIIGIPGFVKEDVKEDYAYVKLNENYEWGEAVNFFKENGARVTHVIPQYNVVYAANLNKEILKSKYVKEYSYGKVNSDAVEAQAWNKFLDRGKEKGQVGEAHFDYQDGIEIDYESRIANKDINTIIYYPSSEYFIGSQNDGYPDILIEVIRPESNGAIDPNLEDWTSTEESNVINEILTGMQWWDDTLQLYHSDIHYLTFVYEFREESTSYEPISRTKNYGDYKLWMIEILENMGYSANGITDRIYPFLIDRMAVPTMHNPDWSFLIWVVDSSEDIDGGFSGGGDAFAYIGGPFMVMTYNNTEMGINNMDRVTAHEVGHIFWAQDQYIDPINPCSCIESSGYLNIQNQNCETPPGCLMDEPSIMRDLYAPYDNHALDQYGAAQIGWRDTDADGIFDILDTFPETNLNEYLPDPTQDNTPNYFGSASVSPYPNDNPSLSGAGLDVDISLNWIEMIKINPFPQETLFASASDGIWDEGNEDFILMDSDWPFGLSNGVYTFKARAVNNWGNEDTTPATDVLTINRPIQNQGSGSPLVMKQKLTNVVEPQY